MADENSPPPAPAPIPQPWFSNLCPNDLGLKAAFLSGEGGNAVTFRPLVGWLVVANGSQFPNVGPLEPLALNEFGFPRACRFIAGYIGVFEKDVTSDEALKKSEQWRAKPGPAAPGDPSPQLN